MLYASDALTIADKIDDFRPYMMEDLDKVSNQIYETAKRGKYETEYDVFYEGEIFVELLGEELENYGYRFEFSQKYTESKGVFYTVRISWYDENSLM